MYRAMIVDDDRWALKDICSTFHFQQQGFGLVSSCTSGEEAEAAFEHLRPDVLITDIQLGGMDGLELMHRCLAMKNDLITIIVSGHSDFSYAKDALNGGAAHYLLKPIDGSEAVLALQKCYAALTSHKPKDNEDCIASICSYVGAHLSPSLTLAEIANQYYLNVTYLSELFQRRMGVSFSAYKKKRMLEKACDVLKQRDSRVMEASESCGFQDIHYFSRWFKEQTKMSPKEYKELFCRR